jgi:hypothetical protein
MAAETQATSVFMLSGKIISRRSHFRPAML